MGHEIPHVDGVQHRFVVANGVRLHVAEAGERGAVSASEAVVMLHGWPQNWFMWRRLMPELARERRVIAPDLRGLGWSEAPPRDYRKETLADDLLALLDELEVERASLVGHDWGGYVAFLACLRAPERFDRHLALAIAPPLGRPSARSIADTWRFWYQVVLASPLGALAAASFATDRGKARFRARGGDAWNDAELEHFLGQFRDPDHARASKLYYRDFLRRELPALAGGRYADARLEVTTRLLVGTEDPVLTPAMLELPDRAATDYEFELLPGVGHFIVEERPELVRERAMGGSSRPCRPNRR